MVRSNPKPTTAGTRDRAARAGHGASGSPIPEWEEVKKAAEKHDVPAGKLVRDTVLDLASGRTGAASGVLPPGHAALLEGVYRGVYILSTLKREEMLRQGRGQELDEVVQAARNAQAEALKQSRPGQRE